MVGLSERETTALMVKSRPQLGSNVRWTQPQWQCIPGTTKFTINKKVTRRVLHRGGGGVAATNPGFDLAYCQLSVVLQCFQYSLDCVGYICHCGLSTVLQSNTAALEPHTPPPLYIPP